MYAPDQKSALQEIVRFSEEYEARYPKAVETLTKDQDQLLPFSHFPAEHWVHLRPANLIEPPFATVKARTKKTKGPGSRQAGLATAFKLLLAAEDRWRRLSALHVVALVKAGVKFPDGRAETLQSEKPGDDSLFSQAPAICAASEVTIHNT